jgi:hypothetical protein
LPEEAEAMCGTLRGRIPTTYWLRATTSSGVKAALNTGFGLAAQNGVAKRKVDGNVFAATTKTQAKEATSQHYNNLFGMKLPANSI